MMIDGALDGRSFLAYVEQVLAPTLRAGEIVVLDNVSTHKVVGAREAIDAKGAKVLYLPPYSPDFNPIEKSISKIKSVLQRIAARTIDTLDAAVAQTLRRVTPSERSNYLAASGYDAV
jgi:transposase